MSLRLLCCLLLGSAFLRAQSVPMGALPFANAAPQAPTDQHARTYNGTSDHLVSAASLSGMAGIHQFSITFALSKTAWSGTVIIAESSANYNSNAGAFVVFSSPSVIDWAVRTAGGYTECTIPVGSTGSFHWYTLTLDTSGSTGTCTAYKDGGSVTATVTGSSGSTAFTNQTLNVMSRNGTSLFSAGTLSSVSLYSGVITLTDAAALASCGSPSSVKSATVIYYWPMNQGSPEPASVGGTGLNVTGSANATGPCTF